MTWRLISAVALAMAACDDGAVGLDRSDVAAADRADGPVRGSDAAVEPPPSRPVFVDPVADEEGADGTASRPYPLADLALVNAAAGDVVVLLPGNHPTITALRGDVELWGSGVGVTQVEGPLAVVTPGVRIRGLTVVGGNPALALHAPCRLEDVDVRRPDGAAIAVTADVELVDVAVEGGESNGADPAADPAELFATVQVALDARLVWRGGAIRGSAVAGLRAVEAQLDLETVDIVGAGSFGAVIVGGSTSIRDAVIRDVRAAGVRFIRAEAEMDGAHIADVAVDPDRGTGSGVGVVGGHVMLRDITVERALDRAFRVALGARLEGERLVALESGVDGLGVGGDAAADVDGLVVDTAGTGGVTVVDGEIHLRDVEVRNVGRHGFLIDRGTFDVDGFIVRGSRARGFTLVNAAGVFAGFDVDGAPDLGFSLRTPSGAIALRDGVVRNAGAVGIAIEGPVPSPVELVRVRVEGTVAGGGESGEGIQLRDGALVGHEVTSARNAGPGLVVDGSTVQIADSVFEENGGEGAVVIGGAGTFERTVAIGNRAAGFVFAESEGRLVESEARNTDFSVADGLGEGLAALINSRVEIEGGCFADNQVNGLYAFGRSTIVVSHGARLTGNGGFGVYAFCDGSLVQATLDVTIEDNVRGARNPCP